MRNKTTPSTIKDILSNLSKSRKWDQKLKQYSLWNYWEKIVGTKIAAHTEPQIWQGNTLVVSVDNTSWLQELKFLEREILEKIKGNFPEIPIQKIHWRLK